MIYYLVIIFQKNFTQLFLIGSERSIKLQLFTQLSKHLIQHLHGK